MNLCTRTSHAVATTSAMLRACLVLVIFELTRGGSALSLRTATTTQPPRLIYTDLHAYNAFRTSFSRRRWWQRRQLYSTGTCEPPSSQCAMTCSTALSGDFACHVLPFRRGQAASASCNLASGTPT